MASEMLQRQKDMYLHEFTAFGGNYFFLLTAIIFLLLGSTTKFYFMLTGFAAIYLVVGTIRTIFHKPRPVNYKYSNFIEKIDAGAFPSVHATRSTFLALVLGNYFQNTALNIFFAILVALACFSRVSMKKHDWKDIIGGIVLGVLIYYSVSHLL